MDREMEMVSNEGKQKNIKGFIVTNLDIAEHRTGFLGEMQALKADGTAIKTAARYNPTLLLLKDGTILKKWSAVDFDAALRYFNKGN